MNDHWTNLAFFYIYIQKLDSGKISSMNVENINVLAKALSTHPEEYFPWLVECCKTLELSKTLFLLVLLQSFTLLETGNFMTMIWCASAPLCPRLSFLTMVLRSCIFFNLLIGVSGSVTDSNFKNSGLYKLIFNIWQRCRVIWRDTFALYC